MTNWITDVDIILRIKAKSALIYGLAIAILSTIVTSSPEATFPINSQVPLVARVGESYNFTLSPTTFTSNERIIRYSLEENPTWLRIDPSSRTLSGVPREDDVGAFDFDILATDATGVSSMRARLIVASMPMQDFGSETKGQLERHGSLNGPNSILLGPSQRFELKFDQKTDQRANSRLSYYATMSDHSPLPPWIMFDNSTLRFHGVAPSLEAYPREYKLLFIASDVPGYAGATFGFSLVVSNHDFRFVPQRSTLTRIPGESFEFAGLRDAIFMDGKLAKISELKSVKASPPSNLYFESHNFVVKGVAASESQTFSIIAEDRYANTAECTLTINPEPKGPSGRETVSAFRGSAFEYKIPQALISQHQQIEVHFREAAPWLDFDKKTHIIKGYVPLDLESSFVMIAIETTSTDNKMNETRDLVLQIESKSSTTSFSPSQSSISLPSPPDARENTAAKIRGKEKRQSKKSALAIAVSISSVMLFIMLATLLIMLRKHCVRSKFRKNLERRNISLPISQPGTHQTDFDNSYNRNNEDSLEKANHLDLWHNVPPQLSPVIPRRSSKRRSWQKAIFGPNQEAEIINFDPEHDEGHERLPKRRSSMTPKGGQATDVVVRERCSSCNLNLAASYTPQPLIVYPGDRHPPIYGDSIRARHCHQCTKLREMELRQISSSSTLFRSLSVASFTPSVFPVPPLLTKAFYRRSTPNPLKQNSIRLVPKTPSVLTLADSRTISEKRQSYIRARVSGPSPFFSAGSYKKSTHSANGQNIIANPSNQPSSSDLQREYSCEGTLDSVLTKPPSLATAEREIEEFWINYSSANTDLLLNRLNRRGFIKDSLDKLEGSSQYTSTLETTSQTKVSSDISPAETQNDETAEYIRPISTKVVDRPHPLVGRRSNIQKRKSRVKSYLYLPTSKLRKRFSHSGPISSFLGEETYLDLDTKKGLGIVLDLNSYEGNEISTDDCNHTMRSRSLLSEISNNSPKPRLVSGKGKRPVSVQGIKHEDRWGSLNGMRGNEAFI